MSSKSITRKRPRTTVRRNMPSGSSPGGCSRKQPDPVRNAVSIIVPAYNAEATLPECLKAIRAAMQSEDELILFDDGSTDGTRSIAEAAGARIISNAGKPKGPAHGRNKA